MTERPFRTWFFCEGRLSRTGALVWSVESAGGGGVRLLPLLPAPLEPVVALEPLELLEPPCEALNKVNAILLTSITEPM